jgi:hypothetical protein
MRLFDPFHYLRNPTNILTLPESKLWMGRLLDIARNATVDGPNSDSVQVYVFYKLGERAY